MADTLETKTYNEETERVKDIVQGVLKAKKILRMYPRNNPIYFKILTEIYEKFKKFLQLRETLQLKIHQNEIICEDEKVYHSAGKEDNLALFFFKDGIREITFLNGLGQNEFETFMKIINTDFENIAIEDDVVTLLWEQDFEHIKYVVSDDVLSDEDYQNYGEYEKIKDKSCPEEAVVKAYQDGLKAPETQSKMPVQLDEVKLQHIAKEIEHEETHPHIDKTITMLFELLYQTKEDPLFTEIVKFIEDAIYYCIKNGDLKNTSFILDSTKSAIDDAAFTEENIKTLRRIHSTINSRIFIQEIGRVLDSDVLIEENEFMSFTKYFNKTSIPFLIQLLGDLKEIKSRRLMINTLSTIGRLDVKTLAEGLNDERWYVVRNIILVLGTIADSWSLDILSKAVSHSDKRVRKEALKMIGLTGRTDLLSYVKDALNDHDSSVRMTAVRTLSSTKSDEAKQILLAELSKKIFNSKEFTEKKEFYDAIPRWQDRDVINFLLETLNKKKIWGRTKNDETRACAAYALGIIGEKEAIPYLEKTKNSKNKLLNTYSVAALKRLKG